MKIMMMVSLINSSVFMNTTNPMIMVILILTQTLIVCMVMWLTMQTTWFAYILFLIFMGGLMVLFIYMCSMAPNEKIKISVKAVESLTIITTSVALMTLVFKKNEGVMLETTKFIKKMMFMMSVWPVVMSMIYLLFTLIVVVKISNSKMGPLRSYKY